MLCVFETYFWDREQHFQTYNLSGCQSNKLGKKNWQLFTRKTLILEKGHNNDLLIVGKRTVASVTWSQPANGGNNVKAESYPHQIKAAINDSEVGVMTISGKLA